jgi:RHS repeat-associated protein
VINSGNRLTTFGPYTLQYDNDGNLTSKTGNGLTETFFWNALGQLDSVTKNGSTTRYGYDGFGRRVRKTTPTGTLRYLYDGDNLFMELDGSGNVVREYTFYPGVDEPHSMRTGGQTYYYITERPGHVSGLVNSAGQVVNKYTYTPWGKAETVQETVANPLRYTAREYDAESGLYFYRARYYDPELGRFISEDPIRLNGGINPYAYVDNDPLQLRDPYGLCRELGSVRGQRAAEKTTQDNDWCPVVIRIGPRFLDGSSQNFLQRFKTANANGGYFWANAGGVGKGDPAALLLVSVVDRSLELSDPDRKCDTGWAVSKAFSGIIPGVAISSALTGTAQASAVRSGARSGAVFFGRGIVSSVLEGGLAAVKSLREGFLGGLAAGFIVADVNLWAACQWDK